MKALKYFAYFLAAAMVLGCANKPTEPEETQPENTDPVPLVSPEGSVENDIVYAYMQCGPYEKFGAKTWFKDPVVRATADVYKWKLDRPKPVVVKWDGRKDVNVSLSSGGRVLYQESLTDTSEVSFTSLIPGVTYSYSITSGGAAVKNGSFTPTGQVRMVDIPGSWNWRDIGGWDGLGGHKVRYGWIYRGGSLNGRFIGEDGTGDVYDFTKYVWPEEAQKAIEYIGIKAELDLRGDPDDPGDNGTEYQPHTGTLRHCQIQGVEYLSMMTDMGYMHPLERSTVIQDVAWTIYQLKKGNPVAIHCKSGADRTGAVLGLLEGVLGMSEGDVARDYELTSISTEYSYRNVRYASEIAASTYFLSRKKGIFSLEQESFFEKCYYYLNQYFDDVHINADDIDWYISFMLGWDGFTRPSFAKNYDNNSLEKVFSITGGSAIHTYSVN